MKFLAILFFLSSIAFPCENETPPKNDTLSPQLIKMVKLINLERQKRGLHKLEIDAGLNCAAQNHSDDVGPKKLCQHEGTDGSEFWERAKKCGARASRENIACGQRTPREAVKAWLKSPGHYKNMMSKDIRFIGVGENNYFWTNIFR